MMESGRQQTNESDRNQVESHHEKAEPVPEYKRPDLESLAPVAVSTDS